MYEGNLLFDVLSEVPSKTHTEKDKNNNDNNSKFQPKSTLLPAHFKSGTIYVQPFKIIYIWNLVNVFGIRNMACDGVQVKSSFIRI